MNVVGAKHALRVDLCKTVVTTATHNEIVFSDMLSRWASFSMTSAASIGFQGLLINLEGHGRGRKKELSLTSLTYSASENLR